MNRLGTSHFVSLGDAVSYYRSYFEGSTAARVEYVKGLVNTGGIHIGPPPIKPGQTLSVIRGEGRYEIIDYPSVECPQCINNYWACRKCGASPMGRDPEDPPILCQNPHCKEPEFEFIRTRLCCRRYGHHIGSTCEHCGQEG